MKKIIIHVGPGKCGSSSIQSDLMTEGSMHARRTAILPQQVIGQLDCRDPDKSLLEPIETIIGDLKRTSDVVVLSHEVLFNRVDALVNIARLSTRFADEVVIVGYSRRQSDFLKSAYGQWHFRSPERTREVCDALTTAGLDPVQFSGVERFYIAAVKTRMATARQLNGNAILHWGPRYETLVDRLSDLKVTVSVGHIPGGKHRFSLIDDFHRRCGLDRGPSSDGGDRIVNSQFDPALIEAVNLAVMNGLTMPGPHEHNAFLEAFPVIHAEPDPEEDRFLEHLKTYTDSFFWPENQAFCRRFGLDEDYFRPRVFVSRQEIDDIIAAQAQARGSDPSYSARRNGRTASVPVKAMFETYLAGLDP